MSTLPVLATVIVYVKVPGALIVVRSTSFCTVSDGLLFAVTVAWSWLESVPPALAVAVLVTEPPLRSAWVIV